MNASELQVMDEIVYRKAGQRKYRRAVVEYMFAAGEVADHAVAVVIVAGDGRRKLDLTTDLKLSLVTR
jgi:hypothetical protein